MIRPTLLRTAVLTLSLVAGLFVTSTPLQAVHQPAARTQTGMSLEAILSQIDQAAPHIHSVIADSQSDQYTAIVDDHTIESGKLYYRKTSHGPELALDITQPPASQKTFIYKNETGWMYVPQSRQVQKYDLSKNRSVVEQFLLLGLGGRGHDLLKSFTVRLAGRAALDGTPTVELELKPRQADLSHNIVAIDLWYSTHTWVAVQQKVIQQGGDYRQLHYTHIELNPHVPDSRFDTRFPGATVVSPH